MRNILRIYETHKVRLQRELSSCLWDFATMPGDGGEPARMKVTVSSCRENCPGSRTYRGRACYERNFRALGNIRQEIKGVSHTAEVFVDEGKEAVHYNAYTPFAAVIRNLRPGSHKLRVCVDIPLTADPRSMWRMTTRPTEE